MDDEVVIVMRALTALYTVKNLCDFETHTTYMNRASKLSSKLSKLTNSYKLQQMYTCIGKIYYFSDREYFLFCQCKCTLQAPE